MKTSSKVLTLSLFACLTSISSQALSAEHSQIYKVKPGFSLTIFNDPTSHSRAIKQLPENSRWIKRLSGIKEFSSSILFQVSWNGQEGWANQKAIIFDQHATSIVEKRPTCLLSKTRSKDC